MGDRCFGRSNFIGRSPTCETPDTIGRAVVHSIFQPAERSPDRRVKSQSSPEKSRACFGEAPFSCPFPVTQGSEENGSKKNSRAHVTRRRAIEPLACEEGLAL